VLERELVCGGWGGGEAGKDNVRDGKGKGEGGGKITGD
jgi:hypothetical protein